MKNTVRLAVLAAVLVNSPALAQTPQTPLNQNAHITENLVAAQVGDIIRKTCSSISARYMVVYEKMGELETYARAEGYTEAEVKLFLKNKTEKARIKGLADAYLADAGAVAGDEETYCQAGRDEITAETLVGSLLRSWK